MELYDGMLTRRGRVVSNSDSIELQSYRKPVSFNTVLQKFNQKFYRQINLLIYYNFQLQVTSPNHVIETTKKINKL